jgi:D-alanine-D-alanine ligase
MKRIRLALLYGGDSAERDVSITSWKAVRSNLDRSKYEIFDYDIKTDLQRLVSDSPQLNAAFICMHGRGGEDGTIQGLLELLKLPYQGSGVMASAVAMNKRMSKELYERAGLAMPRSRVLFKGDATDIRELESWAPCMVKPVHEGSSIGMSLVSRPEDLEAAIQNGFRYDREVLVEEYVSGVEVTGAVLGMEELRPLPLIEIVPLKEHAFFEYSAKYDPAETDEICPARISPELTRAAQRVAMIAHRVLGCRGYSRTDMIIRNDEIYVLETNTIPGMTNASLFPKAAREAGIEFPQLLDLLIEMAFTAHEKEYV